MSAQSPLTGSAGHGEQVQQLATATLQGCAGKGSAQSLTKMLLGSQVSGAGNAMLLGTQHPLHPHQSSSRHEFALAVRLTSKSFDLAS